MKLKKIISILLILLSCLTNLSGICPDNNNSVDTLGPHLILEQQLYVLGQEIIPVITSDILSLNYLSRKEQVGTILSVLERFFVQSETNVYDIETARIVEDILFMLIKYLTETAYLPLLETVYKNSQDFPLTIAKIKSSLKTCRKIAKYNNDRNAADFTNELQIDSLAEFLCSKKEPRDAFNITVGIIIDMERGESSIRELILSTLNPSRMSFEYFLSKSLIDMDKSPTINKIKLALYVTATLFDPKHMEKLDTQAVYDYTETLIGIQKMAAVSPISNVFRENVTTEDFSRFNNLLFMFEKLNDPKRISDLENYIIAKYYLPMQKDSVKNLLKLSEEELQKSEPQKCEILKELYQKILFHNKYFNIPQRHWINIFNTVFFANASIEDDILNIKNFVYFLTLYEPILPLRSILRIRNSVIAGFIARDAIGVKNSNLPEQRRTSIRTAMEQLYGITQENNEYPLTLNGVLGEALNKTEKPIEKIAEHSTTQPPTETNNTTEIHPKDTIEVTGQLLDTKTQPIKSTKQLVLITTFSVLIFTYFVLGPLTEILIPSTERQELIQNKKIQQTHQDIQKEVAQQLYILKEQERKLHSEIEEKNLMSIKLKVTLVKSSNDSRAPKIKNKIQDIEKYLAQLRERLGGIVQTIKILEGITQQLRANTIIESAA